MHSVTQIGQETVRCFWAEKTELEKNYHDNEWGVPLHVDQKLFEFLILEGAQAGLSWLTILRKRDAFRMAFNDFDPLLVAEYDESKIEALMNNQAIVRNRMKIRSAINNAKAFLKVQEEFGSFDKYCWQFVDGKPQRNFWSQHDQIPAKSPASDALSKDLRLRGFSFVGSTICYAFMQATGMVNDHTINCFRWKLLDEQS